MSLNLLKGKTVLLGVSGSIAAYKSAYLVSLLKKCGADVEVIMTKNATKFIAPLTFSTYTGHKTYVDTFDESFEYKVEHISLADACDIAIIAPATANVIAKLAHGIADDMLTTTLLAVKAPILISPAMNTNMYENPATQDNLRILRERGYMIIEPDSGLLACGVEGKGKMPEPKELCDAVINVLGRPKILKGKKVVISAGPTREPIDPVRFISNHSTGKMGFALARQAALMGAEVTLVSGPVTQSTPTGVNRVDVERAADMAAAVKGHAKDADIVIMSAAVADFTPENTASEKIKKTGLKETVLSLKGTEDILEGLGKNKKKGQFICGFSMETENVIANSKKKLEKKNADMIIANDLRKAGAGFGVDTNLVTIITKDDSRELPLMDKDEVAAEILFEIHEKTNN